MSDGPVDEREGGCLLRIRVLPRGARDELVGLRDGRLCVRTTAPPVEGAANRQVAEFLAKQLGVRKSAVRIVSGESAREKALHIDGVDAATARSRLGLGE